MIKLGQSIDFLGSFAVETHPAGESNLMRAFPTYLWVGGVSTWRLGDFLLKCHFDLGRIGSYIRFKAWLN